MTAAYWMGACLLALVVVREWYGRPLPTAHNARIHTHHRAHSGAEDSMSRSGYNDESDGNTLGLYRNAVERAIRGKRGQALLRETLTVLDAVPVKELAAHVAQNERGQCCTLGAVALARGVNMGAVESDMEDAADNGEYRPLARRFDTPAQRWVRVRAWVAGQITEVAL